MIAIPDAPVYGVDYRAMCLADPCGACEKPIPVCAEFQGRDGTPWCPRCGWHHRYHPPTDETRTDNDRP